jgi:hypothetical protein
MQGVRMTIQTHTGRDFRTLEYLILLMFLGQKMRGSAKVTVHGK